MTQATADLAQGARRAASIRRNERCLTGNDASAEGSTTASDAGDRENEENEEDARRSPLPRPKKAKRSTYDARREDKAALQQHIEQLQQQFDRLDERHAGDDDAFDLQRSLLRQRQLKTSVRQQNLALAETQSMLSAFRASPTWRSPVSTYIHLPQDMGRRRRLLAGLYDESLAVATAFLRARTRSLDLRQEHCHLESFELAAGEFVFTQFDVTPFRASVTAKHLYDAVLQHLHDHEMSLSEILGMTTIVAAETDGSTAAVRQSCLLSSIGDGLELEANSVTFSKFMDDPDDGVYAIASVDCIDQDDLLVGSSQRLRKDISACCFITTCPAAIEGGESTVSLTRWTSMRLHAPPVPLTREQAAAVRKHLRAWPDVMLRVLHEQLGMR